MKKTNRPTDIHQTRAAQVAAHLKKKLAEGEWEDRLPGERILAKELGIGRMTLRNALDELQREGLIRKDGPAGTRVRKSRRIHAERPKSVGLLIISPADLQNSALQVLDELRRIFYAKNIALHLHDATSSPKRGPFPFFKNLLHTLHYDCWILSAATLEMQMLCESNRIPVVLAGPKSEQVAISYADIHYRALCHHAVREMIRRGHRNIVFILPKSSQNQRFGDIESSKGFLEADISHEDPPVNRTIEYHGESIQSICRLVDQLLDRKPRPTAWLIRNPHFLTVMTHLARKNVRIPEDVSLVCRDSELYHQSLVPEPTRYHSNMLLKAKQVANLALRIMANPNAPRESRLVMPDFIKGQTLGTLVAPPS